MRTIAIANQTPTSSPSPVAPTEPPPASFPVDDWQFWIVTLVFLLAIAWILWDVLPIRAIIRRGRAKPRRATLTIEGQKPRDG